MKRLKDLYRAKLGVDLSDADIEEMKDALEEFLYRVYISEKGYEWISDNRDVIKNEADLMVRNRFASGDWILEWSPTLEEYFIVEYTGFKRSIWPPAEVNGMKIAELSPGVFFQFSDIDELIIPSEYENVYGKYGVRGPYRSGKLKRLVIEEGIEHMDREVFSRCEELEYVSLPGSLKSVSAGCFQGCINLGTVKMAEGVRVISSGAFSECGLEEITLPASVEKILYSAFSDNTDLRKVNGLRADIQIGEEVFRGCPEILSDNGGSAFCGVLSGAGEWGQDVVIGDDIRRIANRAFCNSAAESVVMPDTVEKLDSGVFTDCQYLRYVRLSERIREIPAYTFNRCSRLRSVRIPESVEKIGSHAFAGCTALQEVYIGNPSAVIDESAFTGCPDVKINPETGDDGNLYRLLENIIADAGSRYEDMKFPASRTYKLDMYGGEYKVRFRAGKKTEKMVEKLQKLTGGKLHDMFSAARYHVPAEDGRFRLSLENKDTYDRDDEEDLEWIQGIYSFLGDTICKGAGILGEDEVRSRIIFITETARAFTDEAVLREIADYVKGREDEVTVLAVSGMVTHDSEMFCIIVKKISDMEIELTAGWMPFDPEVPEKSRTDFLQSRHPELFYEILGIDEQR